MIGENGRRGVETSRMCERHPAKCFSLGSRARAIYSTGTCRRTVPTLFLSPILSLSPLSYLASFLVHRYWKLPGHLSAAGKCRSNSSTSAELIGQVCRDVVRFFFSARVEISCHTRDLTRFPREDDPVRSRARPWFSSAIVLLFTRRRG